MCSSIIIPGALPVIFAMSVGQVIGIAAFLCYLLVIIVENVARGPITRRMRRVRHGSFKPNLRRPRRLVGLGLESPARARHVEG